jgi:hypothetical protein
LGADSIADGHRQEMGRTKEVKRMTYVPETTFEDMKLWRKKPSSSPTTSAALNSAPQCVEGEQLKLQCDSTIEEWRKQTQPQVSPFVEGGAFERQALQQREEALARRNAASNRMYLHRASCAICRRTR